MSRLRTTAPVLGLVALAGCVGWFAGPAGEEALEAWRAQAREIDARFDRRPSSSGPSQEGKATGSWRAWFDQDELILIRERIRFGEGGVRDARFYYRDGALRYYTAEGRWPELSPAGGEKVVDVRREIVFDGAGREVASREEIDRQIASVALATTVGVRSHAAELERQARGLPPDDQ